MAEVLCSSMVNKHSMAKMKGEKNTWNACLMQGSEHSTEYSGGSNLK